MPRKSSPSVASFGPELLAALLKGATETFSVKLADFDTAFALRQRFYALRAAMRREHHPQTDIVYRTSMALPSKETDGSSILVLRPHDDEFTKALQAAGVKISDTPMVIPESPVEITEGALPSDYIDSLLKGV